MCIHKPYIYKLLHIAFYRLYFFWKIRALSAHGIYLETRNDIVFKIILCIYFLGCAGSSFLHELSSSCSKQGLTLWLQCTSFSLQKVFPLQSTDFRTHGLSNFNSQALEHRLSCDTQHVVLHGMWNLPGSEIELLSPTLVGGFFTTEPTRKPEIIFWFYRKPSTFFRSFTELCLTFYDPMECSTPGLPVHHQLPELAQHHVHRVDDAIQPSHPLLSPSPPTFNLSQR